MHTFLETGGPLLLKTETVVPSSSGLKNSSNSCQFRHALISSFILSVSNNHLFFEKKQQKIPSFECKFFLVIPFSLSVSPFFTLFLIVFSSYVLEIMQC